MSVKINCNAVEVPQEKGKPTVAVRLEMGEPIVLCTLEEAVALRNMIDAQITLARAHRDNILARPERPTTGPDSIIATVDAEPVPNTSDIDKLNDRHA